MSRGIRVAGWLAWPVFTVVALFLLSLAFVAATLGCICVDCGGFNASRAGAEKLAMSIEAFRLDCGRLPDRLDELPESPRDGDCRGPWSKVSDLRDPFGTRFAYWRADDGRTFEVRSIGRDRVYGSADDVATSDWAWPWPPPFWRRQEWSCVIAAAPWFAIPLVPPLWLMVAIVRRIRRAARSAPVAPAS
ncbi:type II secretion system protein GspG [Tahibacter caeni]|uniref:type II secretion system protein GspG n=1 Tax=Tahibacter caeni TaxID=1453545 RepID=UPI002148CA2D|nr:type II secretion system protein GspG [Tahibacter caeni]